MLFILDRHGVPSVAKWVRLGADARQTSTLRPAVRVELAGARLKGSPQSARGRPVGP
jgi:hypothetical protein